MIEGLKRRARKAGFLDRIDARVVSPTSMQLADLDAIADFVFACVVHELPSAASFFSEGAQAMKSGADLLLAEPTDHVSEVEFTEQMKAAADNGLRVFRRPSIDRCIAALLRKS
jgi:hypothetical protein